MNEEYINSNTTNPLFDQINAREAKGKTMENVTELDQLGEETVQTILLKKYLFQIHCTILTWTVRSPEKSSLMRLHLVPGASLL